MKNFAITSAAMSYLLIMAGGCTPTQYARQADSAAYGAIQCTQKVFLDKCQTFDITYKPFGQTSAGAPIKVGQKTILLGSADAPVKLTLDEALEIALRNSRDFQDRKEQLFADALAVMNGRQGWEWPQLLGDVTGDAQRTVVNKGPEANIGAARADPAFLQRLRDGGLLTFGYALDLATDFTAWKNTSVGSLMDANFTQPLLRDAWHGFAYEPQYRLERNFVFQVYDYERFTQTFAASIVTRYYRVLEQRDRLENQASNIQRLKETFSLTKLLVENGEVSRIQQDQAEQNLLQSEVRYQQNQQAYRDALDQFKLLLGLPLSAGVELNYPEALEELNAAGPLPFPVEEQEAVQIAFGSRPDVLIQSAQVRDASRDVELAANNFLPQLDVQLGISAPGTPPRDFARTRFDRHTRQARVVFDYDLNQTDNRDTYRLALIAQDRAARNLSEFLDTVRLDVRQNYRQLVQSRRSYDLQVQSVEIAKRRRKLAALQQKEGQASARDVLEAEEDLRDAQDGLTSALLDYTTTRLQFLAALGMLYVDDKGAINERKEPARFDAIKRCYPYVAQE